MRFSAFLVVLALMLFTTLSVTAAAEEEVTLSNTYYVPLTPGFVTNYGGPGRLKYVRIDMTLMVEGLESQAVLEQQLPLVRNTVVLILTRQNENNVVTPNGQERIRQQLLQALNEALTREVGQPLLAEVLFTNFIYQN
ncbi:MAG TPA: flagellar basal body-associated FliL family protein [Marinospirillum sp.]|uniref:flagellar basal body-associated FliL family protein n=1 Tax=Marinospirillum sp. TaxID=2183934 RepID=UPI002B481756|nr:flagellar basal body-associated FliL family protein [Marinospirillum sp.]HKM14898.1 flagellar basal body-associated FliL family protein [Marinospirillum sp.]